MGQSSPAPASPSPVDSSVYDRSKEGDSAFQEQLLRERAEDKQAVAALTFELNLLREEMAMGQAVDTGTKSR